MNMSDIDHELRGMGLDTSLDAIMLNDTSMDGLLFHGFRPEDVEFPEFASAGLNEVSSDDGYVLFGQRYNNYDNHIGTTPPPSPCTQNPFIQSKSLCTQPRPHQPTEHLVQSPSPLPQRVFTEEVTNSHMVDERKVYPDVSQKTPDFDQQLPSGLPLVDPVFNTLDPAPSIPVDNQKLVDFIGPLALEKRKFRFKIPTDLPRLPITNVIDIDNSQLTKNIYQQYMVDAINQCCPLFAIGAYGQTPESLHPFNILGAKGGQTITLVLYSFLSKKVTTSRTVNDGAHVLRQLRYANVSQFQLKCPRKLIDKRNNNALPKSRLSIRDYLRIYPTYDDMKKNRAVKLPGTIFSHGDVDKVQDFINGRGADGWFMQLFKKPVPYSISDALPVHQGHKVTIEDSKLSCLQRFSNGRQCACLDIVSTVCNTNISDMSPLNAMMWVASITPGSSTAVACSYPVDYTTIAYFPSSQHQII